MSTTRRDFVCSTFAAGAYTTVPHVFAAGMEEASLPEQGGPRALEIIERLQPNAIEASRLRLSVAKSAATPLIRDFSAYCN